MSQIFNYDKPIKTEEVEEETCETCELLDNMFDFIFNIAENREEVISYLVYAIQDARLIGYREAMKEIAVYSVMSIDDVDNGCACDCDECCDECCGEREGC